MNIDQVKKIYKGNDIIKYVYNKNLKIFSPIFNFLKLTDEVPWQITVDGAGETSINGHVWNWNFFIGNNRWLQNNSTAIRIQFSSIRNQWELISTSLTSTYVYFCSAYDFFQFPKDQWISWNSSWSPAPTLTKITSGVPVLSQFVILNNPPFQIEPPLILNQNYYFDTDLNSFVGITSSTVFDSITSIFTRFTPIEMNLSKLPNLKHLNFDSRYGNGLNIVNNSKIKEITYKSGIFNEKIKITNNNNLDKLIIGNLREILPHNKIVIENNPNLTLLSISLNNLSSYSVNQPLLTSLVLQCTGLKQLNLANIGNLNTFEIKYTSLTGFNVLDKAYNSLSAAVVQNSDNIITLNYTNSKEDAENSGVGGIDNINLLGRSVSSNDAFLFLYRNNKLNTNLSNGRRTVEIDPLYPKIEIPESLFTTTHSGSTVIFNAPVVDNSQITYQRASFLSGSYVYSGNTINGRSVFSNLNDYHILYNNIINAWTLVGPTSTSNMVWVSAYASVADFGNVPSVGWRGQSWQTGNWQGDSKSPWYTSSSIYSTTMMLYLSSRYESNEGRYHANPYSGYNSNFYWNNLDFSGVGWNVGSNIQQPISQRAILISPIHFAGNTHWPSDGWKNKNIGFYHYDGSVSIRQCLSSVDLGSDRCVGILNAPVSASYYRVGINSYLKNIEIEKVKNFIWGPSQYGKVGIAHPITDSINSYNSNAVPTLYRQISSIPASLWYGERLIGGDSSSPYWYINNNELILIGSELGAGPSGPRFNIQTSNQTMTALSLQFFGENTYVYTLSTYNFE